MSVANIIWSGKSHRHVKHPCSHTCMVKQLTRCFQATSLQNVDFKMKKGSNQQGIFMDNGSGGWLSDLTFTGGKYGAFLGSQQFTSRNLVFTDCSTAIFMNWNWVRQSALL